MVDEVGILEGKVLTLDVRKPTSIPELTDSFLQD